MSPSNLPIIRCQRIGCDCLASDDTKCVHHTQPPVFQDGEKRWPCCNKRSKDFNEFLQIRGCRTEDSHSREKPTTTTTTTTTSIKKLREDEEELEKKNDAEHASKKCPRCLNGFACEDHPEESRKNEEKEKRRIEERRKRLEEEAAKTRAMDPNCEQTCKRMGCGMKFKECDNTETSCRYHKGKPIFHERSKGWSCCASGKKAVYDFDEFLKIPPCEIGKHSSSLVVEE